MKIKYFSMFSGVEGFGQGIEGEPIGFSEIDKYASMVLKYRFPKVKNYGDCTTIKWDEVADFDMLVGGSPCQDFSIAGKRRGLTGSRSSLAWEFIRCLRTKKPRYFIWENVKGVMSSRSGWDFANIITAFSESGYSLWWQVLNAKDFGVPQNRERIFVVGFREGSPKEVFFKQRDEQTLDFIGGVESERKHWLNDGKNFSRNFPQGQRVYGTDGIAQTQSSGGGGLGAKTGLYYVAPNKKEIDITEAPEKPFQLQEVRTELGKQTRKEIRQREGRDSTKRGKNDKKYIPKTDDLANCLTTGKDNIEKWVISKTIRGGGRGSPHGSKQNWDSYEVEGKIRRLTPTECERLMSWPDDWTKWGTDGDKKVEISDSQRYKMCGNGVVSNVVREIVKNLL